MEITKEQYEVWRSQTVTQEIFRELKSMQEQIKDNLAGGGALNPESGEKTMAAYSRMLGNIEVIDQILNIDYEEEGE